MDADRSSLLRHTLGLRVEGPRPGVPRAVDGEGIGGEAIVVRVGLKLGVGAQGPRAPNDIGRERISGAVSRSDVKAVVKECTFVFRVGVHWNERAKTKM